MLTDFGYLGGTLIQNINTMFLVFTFLFGRVCFQLYIVVIYAMPWLWSLYTEKEGVPVEYKFLLVEMQGAVIVNIILNFMWSWLLIKKVYYIITLGSESDKGFADNESVEKAKKQQELEKSVDLEEPAQKKSKQVEMGALVDANQAQSDQQNLQ